MATSPAVAQGRFGTSLPGDLKTGLRYGVRVPVSAGGGYAGVGDLIGSAVHFYGVRALDAAHADGAHKALQVTKSTTSETCDVLLNTAGGLGNTSTCNMGTGSVAIASYCSGVTCYVTTVYDQGSAANDANGPSGMPTGSPTLSFSCSGLTVGKPCLVFAGGQALATASADVNPSLTVVAHAVRTGANTSYGQIIGAGDGAYFNNSTNQIGGYFSGNMTNATATDGTWYGLAWVVVNSASASSISVDGTPTVTASALSGPLTFGLFLGASSSSPGQPLTGQLTETAVYASALTTGASSQVVSLCHNERIYYGSTGSC